MPTPMASNDAAMHSSNAAAPVATAASGGRAKVEFLDGIRGAAAILVVCHHLGFFGQMNVGGLAVHIFFVLSSFLLTMLLERKLAMLVKQGASPKRWLYALVDYSVRRVLRVYPLFFIVVVGISMSSDDNQTAWYHVRKHQFDFWKTITFAEGHRHFVLWTLPLELTYYLLIPVMAVCAIGLRKFWWLPVLPLTYWIVHTGLYDLRRSSMGLRPHLPTFVCGSLAAIVYNRIDSSIQAAEFKLRWWHIVLLRTVELAVFVLLLSVSFDALVFDPIVLPYPFKVEKGDHFVCIHVSIIIVCEMLHRGSIASLFEWSLLRYAGKISFSMYLIHPRIIYSGFILGIKSFYTKYFMQWALIFLCSTVSYHVIEYPCQLLANWIGSKIKALDARERVNDHSNSWCCKAMTKKEKEELTIMGDAVVVPDVAMTTVHLPRNRLVNGDAC